MSKRPAFWVLLLLVSLSGIGFAFRYFPEAFPIVTLDLRMDRAGALEAARALAKQHGWGPEAFSQAASFGLDQEVQNYVELEAGGSRAFKRLLEEGLYHPYTWRVRHFKEGDANETVIRFTPEGEPYGFWEQLPESQPGSALSQEEARRVAERTAVRDWGVTLSDFRLVESSQETRPSGRIDHTFVYERPDQQIGEGFYRLQLVVGGDRLTTLRHFVKVPEAFGRRYAEMRSANNTIAAVASFAMVVLYVLIGCVLSLFFLLRQRWVLWKRPLLWALVVSALNLLAGLSAFPLSWMEYNTAVSAQGFVIQRILAEVGEFAIWTLVLALSFMAAESLTRKAFPKMPQMWRLWSREAASSREVLGRTLGGYLIVGFDFGFVVAVYFLTTRYLGWWTPSDVLFHPDVLATYAPWLSPVALSLRAGFWEECLFRAVPLAGAAVLGQRFGKRNTFLVIAFVVQALIFGAGHANYPSQPAYARVVELIIPSFVFGGIYLSYGLLPAIVSHFVFDVVWMALPLFVSSAKSIWLDQLLVVLLTLTPVWVVLRARLKRGSWTVLPEEVRNGAWQPPAVVQEVPPPVPVVPSPERPALPVRYLALAGAAGLLLWLGTTRFRQDAPGLGLGRVPAAQEARAALAEKKGVQLGNEWTVLPVVAAGVDDQDRFVWQKGGREAYEKLMGRYLPPPAWSVRFARFTGDLEQRAEEYQVMLSGIGQVQRIRHVLPESQPSPSLTESEARQLALQTLKSEFQMEADRVKEVSAVESKLPNRHDWRFEFSDAVDYPLSEGQARIGIELAGNEVSDASRFVFLPEAWKREQTNARNLTGLLEVSCWAFLGTLLLAAAVRAVIHWSRKSFAVKSFVIFFLLILIQQGLDRLIQWPAIQAGFSTSQPVSDQILVTVMGALVGSLLMAGLFGLLIGHLQVLKSDSSAMTWRARWAGGLAVAFVGTGLMGLLNAVAAPSTQPLLAEFGHLGTYAPWLSPALDLLNRLLTIAGILLLLFVSISRLSSAGRHWLRQGSLFLLTGLMLSGLGEIESVRYWVASGVVLALLLTASYHWVFSRGLSALPIAVGGTLVLSALNEACFAAYPGAVLGGLLGIGALLAIMEFWSAHLQQS
ncbi:MAG: CPBP family intramembrane glutamic endopeptidase [Acidobacteriota bacterium]